MEFSLFTVDLNGEGGEWGSGSGGRGRGNPGNL